jgi:hypothetical protein
VIRNVLTSTLPIEQVFQKDPNPNQTRKHTAGKFGSMRNSSPRHEGVLGKWRYSYSSSLTSALDGGEWSASRPGRFIPKEKAPGTHRIAGWVGPRAILDTVVKRKIPSPCRESNPRTPIVQPIVRHGNDKGKGKDVPIPIG